MQPATDCHCLPVNKKKSARQPPATASAECVPLPVPASGASSASARLWSPGCGSGRLCQHQLRLQAQWCGASTTADCKKRPPLLRDLSRHGSEWSHVGGASDGRVVAPAWPAPGPNTWCKVALPRECMRHMPHPGPTVALCGAGRGGMALRPTRPRRPGPSPAPRADKNPRGRAPRWPPSASRHLALTVGLLCRSSAGLTPGCRRPGLHAPVDREVALGLREVRF